MEMPFSASGKKAHADAIDEQWKKKVIYKVDHCFPHLMKRLPIISMEEVSACCTAIINMLSKKSLQLLLLQNKFKVR